MERNNKKLVVVQRDNERELSRRERNVTKRMVKQMIESRLERKYGTFDTTNYNVPLAGSFTKLTPMAQGVGQSARVGDEVTLKSLRFRYTITVGAPGLVAAADQYNVVRVCIFKYLQDDGLASPNNNILSAASSNNTLNPINPDYKDEYIILYDKSHVVYNSPIWNGSAVSWQHGVGGTYTTPDAIHIPLKGKVHYQQGATTGVGHIYLCAWSDSAFTPNPTLELVSVVEYDDG